MLSAIGSTLFPVDGKVFGSDHWKDIQYRAEEKVKKDDHADIKFGVYDASAGVAGEDGKTRAPVYQKMGCKDMVVDRSILCIISAPFYIVGTAAYYLLRIIPVTIWIIGGILKEKIAAMPPAERKYKWSHIPQEAFYSLKQLVKTGYGLGYFAGLCISIFSPLNGWKIASSYEKAWSDGADPQNSTPIAPLLLTLLPCIVIPAVLMLPYFFSPSGFVILKPFSAITISSALVLTLCVAYAITNGDWKSSYHPHGFVPLCRQPIGHVIVPEEGLPTTVESMHENATFTIKEIKTREGWSPAGCPRNTPCCYLPVH